MATKVPNMHGPIEQMRLLITHVPTGRTVSFKAYLETFSDMYTSEWNAEDVYGRMDPIATFINTRRSLSLAWNVPAVSYEDAQNNLRELNNLLSFLYPLYEVESVGGATAINQSPLMRISFGNLIRNAQTGKGLLGYVNGFTFDPDLEAGMFYGDPSLTAQRGAIAGDADFGVNATTPDVEYLPKTFRLNTEFNVLHEHSLGFQRADNQGKTFSFRAKGVSDCTYPYFSNTVPKNLPTPTGQAASSKRQKGFEPGPAEPVKPNESPLRKPPKSEQELKKSQGSAAATMAGAGGSKPLSAKQLKEGQARIAKESKAQKLDI